MLTLPVPELAQVREEAAQPSWTEPQEPAPAPEAPAWTWGETLPWLWLAGCGGMLLWQAAGTCLLRRKLLRETEERPEDQVLLARLWQGMHGRPQVLRAEAEGPPLSMGLFRPVVLLPAAIVYGGGGGFALRMGMAAVLLPLFPLSLSCFFGWLIGLLTARMRRKNLFSVALSLLFLAAYLLLYTRVNAAIQAILRNSQAVAEAVRGFLYPFYLFGLGMAGEGWALGLFLAGTAAVFALVCWVLSRTFIRIATAPRRVARRAWRVEELRAGSAGGALVKKELGRFFGSSVYLLNAGIGALLMLIAAAFLVVKGRDVEVLADQLGGLTPDLLPALAVVALCFLAGEVDLSTSSISLEGKTLWLMKSLPLAPWEIFRAKLLAHLVVCLPPLLLCEVAAIWALRPAPAMGVLLVVTPLAFAVCKAAAGLAINLRLPKLDWDNEAQPVKQSAASMIAVLGAMGVTAVLAVPCFVLAGRLHLTVYFSAWTAALLLAAALCLLWLKKRGAERWTAL